MQKFIHKNGLAQPYYLPDDFKASDVLDLNVWRLMTETEILKHESNPRTDYHVWSEEKISWVDSRTPQEILEYTRTQMPTLSKREFRKRLRDANLFEQVDAYVKASNDGYLQDAWEYADYFTRLDPFIIQASLDLGLTPERVDQIWVKAS